MTLDPQMQIFFSNSFNGGAGTDRVEVSGNSVNLGGLGGSSNFPVNIEDRALLGIEEIRFNAGADPVNVATVRRIDLTAIDGVSVVRGNALYDELRIFPEAGHTYADGYVVDLRRVDFGDATGNGPERIWVEGTAAGEVFYAADAPGASYSTTARGGDDTLVASARSDLRRWRGQ